MSAIRKILVDTTLDITCPFCMMSSHQLLLALDKFHSEQPGTRVEIKVHPFLLDPDASNEPRPVQEVMSAKFGEEKAGEIRGMMKGKFEALGLKLNQQLSSSTIRSHRLIAKAPISAQFPLALALMKAYHTAGKAPSDIAVLSQAAIENGVFKDETIAMEFINSDKLERSVREEARKAKEEKGVKTVPHYAFQGEAKPGSKTTEEFIQLFKQYSV